MAVKRVQREVTLYASLSISGKKNPESGSQNSSLRLSQATGFKLGFVDSFSDPEEGSVHSKSCLVFELCFSVQQQPLYKPCSAPILKPLQLLQHYTCPWLE